MGDDWVSNHQSNTISRLRNAKTREMEGYPSKQGSPTINMLRPHVLNVLTRTNTERPASVHFLRWVLNQAGPSHYINTWPYSGSPADPEFLSQSSFAMNCLRCWDCVRGKTQKSRLDFTERSDTWILTTEPYDMQETAAANGWPTAAMGCMDVKQQPGQSKPGLS